MYINLRENQYQTNKREYRHRIQWIQQQIIEENIKINNEYWQRKIVELNEIYKDQAIFWKKTQENARQ